MQSTPESMDPPPPDSSSITPAASSTPRPPPTPAPASGSSHSQSTHPQQQDPSQTQDDAPSSPHQDPSPSSSTHPPPRPPFSPLFTLIHDPSTSTPIHPRNTHYIFSDDDAGSILSPACSRAATHPLSKNPPSSNTPDERILIIDLDNSGTRVTRAASLNPKWQILRAGIANSPTLRGVEGDEEAAGGGAMLKIEGMGGLPSSSSTLSTEAGLGGVEWGRKGDDNEEEEGEEEGNGNGVDIESEAMRALVADFERRMDVLRNVVLGDGTGEVGAGVGSDLPLATGEEKENEKEKEKEKGIEERGDEE